jgi:hypothetical protein
MTEQLEEALSRTLDHAAARAPVPPGDLLSRVESGHRKRRNVRLAVSAGGLTAACAAVLSVTLVVQNLSGTAEQAAPGPVTAGPVKTDPQPSSTLPPQAKAVPIEKLWPKAVHRISNELPDGRSFIPMTLADDQTLLVVVESSFEKANELLAYDLKTKAVRKITDVVTPAKATVFASNFTVGDGQVIWYTMVENTSQIWTAPVSGGPAFKVTEAPGSPKFLAVADGKAFWSLEELDGGLFQAPLTGGSAARVPGTAHEHILSWPWVASPGPKFPTDPIENQVVNRKARNLQTGETRTTKISAPGLWSCGLSWCYGTDVKGVVRAELRDGTLSRTVNISSNADSAAPSLDRFLFGGGPGGVTLYDFRTGKIGSIPLVNSASASPREPYNRLYPGLAKNGYLIVDLAAIP